MKEPAPEINHPPPEVKHDRSVDTRFKPGYVRRFAAERAPETRSRATLRMELSKALSATGQTAKEKAV